MKRKRGVDGVDHARKKARCAVNQSLRATHTGVEHPVLQRLYAQVLTLRHYLLSQIPKSSRGRRRRVDQLGNSSTAHDATPIPDIDIELARLLDSALVTTSSNFPDASSAQRNKEREQEVESFTQQRPPDTAGGTFKPGYFLQSEVCRAT